MKLKFVAAALTVVLATCGAFAQTQSSKTNEAIDGVWRGQMGDLPFITLVMTDEPGSLAGTIQFYFLKRATENAQPTAEPRPPEPIFGPHFDGKSLLFEVSHRRSHPPQSLDDPPKHYRLTLTGPNNAEITNLDEPDSPTLRLVRTNY